MAFVKQAMSTFQGKDSWERCIESENMKKSLRSIPKTTGYVRKDLIDIDLVRGSTFTKEKPSLTWTAATYTGILRVIFFPFYRLWWYEQIPKPLWIYFHFLYCLQIVSLIICYYFVQNIWQEITVNEIVTPILLLFFLGSVYTHSVATYLAPQNINITSKSCSAPLSIKKVYEDEKVVDKEEIINTVNDDSNAGNNSDLAEDCDHSDEDTVLFDNPVIDMLTPNIDSNAKSSATLAKISIWEANTWKKALMNTFEISWSVIHKVESMSIRSNYLFFGVVISLLMSSLPVMHRIYYCKLGSSAFSEYGIGKIALGANASTTFVVVISQIEIVTLCTCYFFLLSVAERVYTQRYLLVKHFNLLTSAAQAQKSGLPHFRLHTVENIKVWLSIRSYLKNHGPQRTVDLIAASSFSSTIILISIICIQFVYSSSQGMFASSLTNWQLIVGCIAISIYQIRLVTLGTKINRKYNHNNSILLTEQINLYLRMENEPEKKQQLVLVNSVLKLAVKLLKELDKPFTISGMTRNPILFSATRLIVLSAMSRVASEMLGFQLKLWKIKG